MQFRFASPCGSVARGSWDETFVGSGLPFSPDFVFCNKTAVAIIHQSLFSHRVCPSPSVSPSSLHLPKSRINPHRCPQHAAQARKCPLACRPSAEKGDARRQRHQPPTPTTRSIYHFRFDSQGHPTLFFLFPLAAESHLGGAVALWSTQTPADEFPEKPPTRGLTAHRRSRRRHRSHQPGSKTCLEIAPTSTLTYTR